MIRLAARDGGKWEVTKFVRDNNHKLMTNCKFSGELPIVNILSEWEALADAAKDRPCFWRFVLLQLSVLRAEILSDGIGVEMAEIETLLEEAAELVDDSLPKNPNYYSTYKILYVLKRQDDGSWRFCKGDILLPS